MYDCLARNDMAILLFHLVNCRFKIIIKILLSESFLNAENLIFQEEILNRAFSKNFVLKIITFYRILNEYSST